MSSYVHHPKGTRMSEPTPEQPEEPKRRDLTRVFSAVVRRPGEKKTLSSYIVTIGMTVVLAGAVALGVGAIVFRPHGKDKTVAAAEKDKRRGGALSPSASPRDGGVPPVRPGAPGAPDAAIPPLDSTGKRPKGASGNSNGGDPADAGTGSGSSGTSGDGSMRSESKASATTRSIVGNASHRCIDVSGGRAADGAAVQIYNCNSSAANQRWSFVNGTLRSMGMCMTAAGSSSGAALQIRSCNGGSAQLFRLTSAGDIVHSGTNTCVDVKDNKTAAGTRLQTWKCNGQANQKWRLS